MNTRIGSTWKKVRELGGVAFGKQSLTLKQQSKIYQCCVRPVILYCGDTWGLVTYYCKLVEARVECCAIRMCGLRLVYRVLRDVLRDKTGVVVMTEDKLIHSRF